MMNGRSACLAIGKLFQAQLWDELVAAGLIPDPERYAAACTQAVHWGVAERDRFRATMGLPAWWCGLAATGLFMTAYGAKGILGWGHALTQFFVAPLPLSSAERDAVASLGTLANFIVTFYDTLLDLGGVDDDPLPRPLLESAVWGTAREPRRWTLLDATPRRVLAGLVTEFFRCMDALPGACWQPEVNRTIRRAILKMYDAELRTLRKKTGREHLSERALRIKSGYPFVVMGLSGWLLVPQIDPAHFWWHLRWLCRLGEFCGWIDDAVDYREDTASARPNRVMSLLAQTGSHPAAAAELAHRIAGQGKIILAEWHDHVQEKEHVSPVVADGFLACLASWSGSLAANQPR